VTTYVVSLSDGRTAQVVVDDLTTRQDGSLWLLRAAAPPPAKLVTCAVFARGVWQTCSPEDAGTVWGHDPSKAPHVTEARTSPRFA